MRKSFAAFMCLLSSIFVIGCGGGGGGGGGGQSGGSTVTIPEQLFTISGIISDGPVYKATVTIRNIGDQKLSGTAITDHTGKYSISIPLSSISALVDADMVLVHAVSTADTKLNCIDATCSNGGKAVQPGQIELRSMVDAKNLKLASQGATGLNGQTPGGGASAAVAAKLNATPISNALVALMEAQLGLTEPIRASNPNVIVNILASVQERLLELDRELSTNPTGSIANKIMNVAIATKAVGENGTTNLVSNTSNLTVSESAEIIRRVAQSTEALQIVVTDMSNLISSLKNDLTLLGDVFHGVKEVIQNNDSASITAAATVDASKITYNLARHLPVISSNSSLSFTVSGNSQTVVVTSNNGLVTLKIQETELLSYNSTHLLSVLGQQVNLNLVSFEPTGTNSVRFSSSENILGSTINGNFYELSIGINPTRKILFASRRLADASFQPLGIVGLANVLDQSGTLYLANSMILNGLSLPAGSFAEAVSLAQNLTPEAIQGVLNIASDLKLSSDLTSRQQGRLAYAMASVARHLVQTNTSSGSNLSALLSKLGVEEAGRSLINFTANIARGSNGGLALNNIQGMRDIQNYLSGTSTSDLLGVLEAATTDLKAILTDRPQNTSLTDTFATLNLRNRTNAIRTEYKDVYYMLAAFEAAKFVVYYTSMHNFDLSDTTIRHYSQTDAVQNAAQAINTYSVKNVTRPATPMLKDLLTRDPQFLTHRVGYLGTTAAAYLRSAADYAALYLNAISDHGGSADSIFYLRGNELSLRNQYLMMAVALYNNLSGSLRTDISIFGKTAGAWYDSADVYPATTPENLRLLPSSNLTQLPSSNLHQFLYYYREQTRAPINYFTFPFTTLPPSKSITYDWIRIDLSTFLNTSMRDLIGTVTQENNQKIEDHILDQNLRSQTLSSSFANIFPGAIKGPDGLKADLFRPQTVSRFWVDELTDVVVGVNLNRTVVSQVGHFIDLNSLPTLKAFLFPNNENYDSTKLNVYVDIDVTNAGGLGYDYWSLLMPQTEPATAVTTTVQLPKHTSAVVWIKHKDHDQRLVNCWGSFNDLHWHCFANLSYITTPRYINQNPDVNRVRALVPVQ